MKRVIRAAAAALAIAGTGSIGCVHTDRSAERSAERNARLEAEGGGGHYRSWVDPCWPERYNATARNEVLAPFSQQVNNGNVLNQTIWNWYFEKGTDKLTPAGRAKLDSIAQTRPAPDTRLYLQAARDVPVTNENIDKVGDERESLTAKRAAAIQKYMGTQPAIGGNALAYEIHVHDARQLPMPADFTATSFRGQARGYTGFLPGGAAGGSAGAPSVGGGAGMGGASTGPSSGAPNPGAGGVPSGN